MRTCVAISLLAVAATFVLPQLARSQGCPPSLLIDDFSTGKHKANLRVGSDSDAQKGSMIGGHRFTHFGVCDPDTPEQCDATKRDRCDVCPTRRHVRRHVGTGNLDR
jgi:hypothetical protein